MGFVKVRVMGCKGRVFPLFHPSKCVGVLLPLSCRLTTRPLRPLFGCACHHKLIDNPPPSLLKLLQAHCLSVSPPIIIIICCC